MPIVGLLVVLILIGIVSPRSLLPPSILEKTKQASYLGIVATGETIVMLTGGLDLSVHEVITFTDVFAADLTSNNPWSSLSVCLLLLVFAAFVGFVNGFMIAKTNIPPLIMTLAMGFALRGAYLIYTQSAPGGSIPPSIRFVGKGNLFHLIPMSTIIWLSIAALIILFLSRFRWGWSVYYVGSNRTASRMVGINPNIVIIYCYMACSVLAAITGLLVAGNLGMGTLYAGEGYMLNPLAASVIGGTTFAGGVGGVGGTVVGAFFMRFLNNFLTLMHIPQAGQSVVQGILILSMVILLRGGHLTRSRSP